MKNFSAALTEAKNLAHSGSPLIWLLRISIDGTPANDLFRAHYHEDISYDPGDGGGVRTWTQISVKIEDISEQRGSLQSIRASVSNVDRDASDRLIAGEILNQRTELLLVNLADLATAGHHESLKFSVREASVTEQWASFTMGQFPYFVWLLPSERYMRDK